MLTTGAMHNARFTPEERLLFACMTPRLTEDGARDMVRALNSATYDWALVRRIATEEKVAPLVYQHLRKLARAGLDVPNAALMPLKLRQFEQIEEKEQNARLLGEALAFFNANDLPAMLVKGAALDAVMDERAWQTTCLDIDILIKPRMADVPESLREEVWRFNRTGPFECDFHTHHDLSLDGILPIDFELIWHEAREIEYLGRRVHVMSPTDMLIAACTNSCRKRYFTLKGLHAIASILHHFGPFEPEALARRAAQHDCQPIVYTALRAARMTVGCGITDALLRRLHVRVGRRQLINFLTSRMSFSPLAKRAGFRQAGAVAARPTNAAKWNLSLLLPYASYRSYQAMRRLGWLVQNTGKSG